LGGIAFLVSIVIVYWLSRLSSQEKCLSIGLSLILGGAIGNLWDRISYGHVIDFIQWYVSHFYWPTFNIADSAICIGAVLLFVHTYIQNQH
jgi:signal peptidase II